MSLNTATIKKLLLTAGLLIVLFQGLVKLPEFQDYLFPVDHQASIISQARKECSLMKADLITLNERVNYLTWFQAHDGPNQEVSADRLRFFPFSKSIRSLAPEFFWATNIRLAHKNRLKVERKLRYVEVLIKNMDQNSPVNLPHNTPAIPAKPAPVFASAKQIQQFQEQWTHSNARLLELTRQLAELENNGYKK